MIGLLAPERWGEIAELVGEHFDAALPAEDQANIIAEFDENDRVTGFVIVEHLLRFGQIYAGGGRTVKRLIEHAEKSIPQGASVIVIASEKRFEPVCERFGLRKVEGAVYRRDF